MDKGHQMGYVNQIKQELDLLCIHQVLHLVTKLELDKPKKKAKVMAMVSKNIHKATLQQPWGSLVIVIPDNNKVLHTRTLQSIHNRKRIAEDQVSIK